MSVPVKDIQELGLDLWENIDPFDVSRQEECTSRSDTKLRFRMQNVKLFDGTVAGIICNKMSIFAENITLWAM